MAKFHSLKVKEVKKETEDCVSVAFELPEQLKGTFDFLQGQYLTLRAEIEGEEVRRNYSICTSPLEKDLRVAIKKVEGGRFSTYANENLRAGDELQVLPAMGKFTTHLDPARFRHYLAIAAGSGITPVMSILKAVLQQEPKSKFTLLYGNRRNDTIIFREALEELKNRHIERLRIHHVLSREDQGAELFTGRIDAQKCEQLFDKVIDLDTVDEVFLCGPQPMIQAASKTLKARGVDPEKIHFELFTTNGAVPESKQRERKKQPAFEARIGVKLDGELHEFPMPSGEKSILDAALEAGADLPFACKGGVCSTCRAKLLEGEVEMDANYALEQDELEAGYILTCQSHPKTKKVVVDFDS